VVEIVPFWFTKGGSIAEEQSGLVGLKAGMGGCDGAIQ
jgi:hypothetical protein